MFTGVKRSERDVIRTYTLTSEVIRTNPSDNNLISIDLCCPPQVSSFRVCDLNSFVVSRY